MSLSVLSIFHCYLSMHSRSCGEIFWKLTCTYGELCYALALADSLLAVCLAQLYGSRLVRERCLITITRLYSVSFNGAEVGGRIRMVLIFGMPAVDAYDDCESYVEIAWVYAGWA